MTSSALFLSPGHRLGVADAAIHRHHQLRLGGQLLQARHLQAVAFLEAVGNIVAAGQPQLGEKLVQYGRGGDAVGVVVAVNGHRLAPAHRLAQAGGGLLQVRQAEGRVEALQAGVEKGLDLLHSVQAPVHQEAGHQGRQPVPGAQLLHLLRPFRLHLPALSCDAFRHL